MTSTTLHTRHGHNAKAFPNASPREGSGGLENDNERHNSPFGCQIEHQFLALILAMENHCWQGRFLPTRSEIIRAIQLCPLFVIWPCQEKQRRCSEPVLNLQVLSSICPVADLVRFLRVRTQPWKGIAAKQLELQPHSCPCELGVLFAGCIWAPDFVKRRGHCHACGWSMCACLAGAQPRRNELS